MHFVRRDPNTCPRLLNFVARQNAGAFAAGDERLPRRQPAPAPQCRVAGRDAGGCLCGPPSGDGPRPTTPSRTRARCCCCASANGKAYEWLVKHTDPEAHWFGRALVVEHGYITDFVARLRFDGFTVDDTQA